MRPSAPRGATFERLAVVAFAPTFIAEDLRKVRARCTPSGRPVLDAHVTVKGGVSRVDDLAPVVEAIRATVSGVNPFTLRTTEPRVISRGDRASIILPLEEAPRLHALHERLVAALRPFGQQDSRQDQPGSFEPHVTVVQDIALDGVERSVREVEGWRLNLFWTVRDVDLVGLDNSPIWRSIKTIRFGRG